MATGKKSFVLYTDYETIFEQLTDSEAGKIIKHLFKYVNDKEPELEDRMLKIVFEPIKQQLKRDLKAWKSERKKRSDAGRKGGLATQAKSSKAKQSQAVLNGAKANQAVTVNVTDTVTVNDNVRESSSAEVFYNAEDLITKNQIQFEKICMAASKNATQAAESLRKYHLYLEENEKYPRTKKSILAGFEKWLRNEKTQHNGNTAIESSGRHKGAGILIAGLKQDFAARRKEDD